MAVRCYPLLPVATRCYEPAGPLAGNRGPLKHPTDDHNASTHSPHDVPSRPLAPKATMTTITTNASGTRDARHVLTSSCTQQRTQRLYDTA